MSKTKTTQERFWDNYFKVFPIKQIKDTPEHFVWSGYDRIQAATIIDSYEEIVNCPCFIARTVDGTYYIIKEEGY